MDKCDIGIIGLGVMGRSISLNFSNRGFSAAVYNPDVTGEEDLLADFLKDHGCDAIAGARIIGDFARLLKTPRIILLMVKAGKPVDDCIARLLPHLDAGDIIIDGGNSHYRDTGRRVAELEGRGMRFVGCGVSGGAEEALRGPSLMPGGSAGAWEAVAPMLRAIAAKRSDGSPCCEWIGPGGSGHFVKMVHNGIEYAMLQGIAEAYDMMKRMLSMEADEIAALFSAWNKGPLKGYLMGIVPAIVTRREKGALLLDSIRDSAWQKGTGRDAAAAALDLGVPVPAIDESVSARFLSSLSEERVLASQVYRSETGFSGDGKSLLEDLESALYCAMAVSLAQGFALLDKASSTYGWGLDRGSIARTWQAGCIIQSAMIKEIEAAFRDDPAVGSLLLARSIVEAVRDREAGWRRAVTAAISRGIPVPALSSTLAYFDAYRTGRLPANLTQAMRDFFGAHGYERVDAPQGTIFRTEWGKG